MEPDEPTSEATKRMDKLQHHLRHPEIDINTYMRAKRLHLGKHIVSLTRIYLDTKYWVRLRDVTMGRPESPGDVQILDTLVDLVGRKKIICPFSYSVFAELMRQTDPATRSATAKLIDVLAEGCCVQNPKALARLQLEYYLRSCMSPERGSAPIAEAVWTKASFVAGDYCLTPEASPPEYTLAVQKVRDDDMWETTLEALVSGPLPDPPFDTPDRRRAFADQQTQDKLAHDHEVKTFDQFFMSEVEGGLHCFADVLAEAVMVHLVEDEGDAEEAAASKVQQSVEGYASALRKGFAKGKVSTEVPCIHILAGLLAALRSDLNRTYKPTDNEDFLHATVALPYYDFFFTDNALRHLICHKPLEYDSCYDTTVLSRTDEIIDALSTLK